MHGVTSRSAGARRRSVRCWQHGGRDAHRRRVRNNVLHLQPQHIHVCVGEFLGKHVVKKAYALSKNKRWYANKHTRASGKYPIMFALSVYGVWQESAKHRLGV